MYSDNILKKGQVLHFQQWPKPWGAVPFDGVERAELRDLALRQPSDASHEARATADFLPPWAIDIWRG